MGLLVISGIGFLVISGIGLLVISGMGFLVISGMGLLVISGMGLTRVSGCRVYRNGTNLRAMRMYGAVAGIFSITHAASLISSRMAVIQNHHEQKRS